MADEKFKRSYLGKLRGGDFVRIRDSSFVGGQSASRKEWKKTKESGGAGRDVAPQTRAASNRARVRKELARGENDAPDGSQGHHPESGGGSLAATEASHSESSRPTMSIRESKKGLRQVIQKAIRKGDANRFGNHFLQLHDHFVSSLSLEDIDELSRAMDGTLGRDHYELIQEKMVQVADGSQASTDGMSVKRSQEVCDSVTRDQSPNEADEDNAFVVDVLQAVENVGIAEER
eukprot:g5248.t1